MTMLQNLQDGDPMTEFTSDEVKRLRKSLEFSHGTYCEKYLERALDHIERLQKRVEELEAVNEDQALTISQNDYAYAVDKEMMEAEIKASNDLLRSAFMIAKRDGKDTNWEAFMKQLDIALARQHAMMYKQQESEG